MRLADLPVVSRLCQFLKTPLGMGASVGLAFILGQYAWANVPRFSYLVFGVAGLIAVAVFVRYPLLGTMIISFANSSNAYTFVSKIWLPILLLSLGAVLLRKVLQGDFSVRISPLVIAALLFIAWDFATVVWAHSYEQLDLDTPIRNLLGVLLLLWTIKTPRQLHAVLACIAIGVTVSAGVTVHSMIQLLATGPANIIEHAVSHTSETRFYGLWDDPNTMALSTVPFIGLSFFLFRLPVKLWMKAVAGLAVISGIVAVSLSMSRGGLIALILMMAAVVMADRRRWLLIAGAISIVVVVMIFAPVNVFGRIASLGSGSGDASIRARAEMIQGGLRMAEEYFPFGSGYGTMGTYAADYSYFLRSGIVAHNAWVDTVATTGLPGIILFITFLSSVMPGLRVKRWRLESNNPGRSFAICGTGVWLAILLSMTTGSYSFYGLMWFVLGLLSLKPQVFGEDRDGETPVEIAGSSYPQIA